MGKATKRYTKIPRREFITKIRAYYKSWTGNRVIGLWLTKATKPIPRAYMEREQLEHIYIHTTPRYPSGSGRIGFFDVNNPSNMLFLCYMAGFTTIFYCCWCCYWCLFCSRIKRRQLQRKREDYKESINKVRQHIVWVLTDLTGSIFPFLGVQERKKAPPPSEFLKANKLLPGFIPRTEKSEPPSKVEPPKSVIVALVHESDADAEDSSSEDSLASSVSVPLLSTGRNSQLEIIEEIEDEEEDGSPPFEFCFGEAVPDCDISIIITPPAEDIPSIIVTPPEAELNEEDANFNSSSKSTSAHFESFSGSIESCSLSEETTQEDESANDVYL